MASVTQKVPNYVLGISTQPDEKKVPGQVTDLVNGVPDVVRQLIKRPGSQLVKEITTTSNPYGDSKTYAVSTAANAKWFSIYTAHDEQYIGQCAADGTVAIWRCSDGASIPVDYADVPGTLKATYLDNTALSDEKSSDIQVLTINETTFFVNRRKDTAMLTGAGDKSPAQLNEAFISLDTITYGKQYALDIFDPDDNTTFSHSRATSLVIEYDGYSGSSNGDCLGMGREVVDISSGRGIGATSPPSTTALTGTYVRSGTTVTCTITNHGYVVDESVTVDFTSGGASDGTFLITSVADANTFAFTHGDSGTITTSNCSIPVGRTNLRYEVDTRCTPQPTAPVDSSYSYHDTYQPFVKLQCGGEGWVEGDKHRYTSQKGVTTVVTVKNTATIESRANIAMVRPPATSSSAEELVSAGGILGDLKAALDAIPNTGITSTIAGNGIHLYRATPFGVTTPEKTLMSVATTEVNNISDLPRVCRHGYVVRVVNSGEDMDDYYLRFQAEGISASISKACTYARSGTTVTVTDTAHGLSNGDTVFIDFTSGGAGDGYYTVSNSSSNTFDLANNSSSGTIGAGAFCTYTPARFGEGVWEEVAAPGIDIKLDKDTMPLKLTRVNPGTYAINGGASRNYTNGCFKFGYPDWGERDVGDDITNSKPTFIGNPIQKMLFFRNRIALLSNENVILSRVNDYYSFWVKTAMAISNADPIDLQSSSKFPTRLFDAVESAGGLVIFSASEQFLLNSGAEALLTPETAKISYLSSYAFNADTSPISLGTTIGFLNATARQSRFYEIANVGAKEEPDVQEQTKIVGELFPQNVSLISGSTENDILLFGVDSTLHTATNEVWGYKWFESGGKRAQSAWFRWTMPNKVIYHTILDDVYYAVLSEGTNNKFTLEKFDLKLTSDTPMIGTAPDENRVHLDTKKTIASGDMTYVSASDTTTFTLGSGYYSSQNLTVYCTTDSDAIGKSYDVPAAKITGTAPNETVTLPGNWKTSLKDGVSVNTDLIVGYEYEFEVELPKIYITQTSGQQITSETRGSLIIHRMNFDFGDVGVIDVTLKRRGRDDYTYTVESLEWDNVLASTATIAKGYLHTIPVYDRNENLTVLLKSNHPSPATIHSMNWEGDYSPRYYQRV